MARIPRLPVGIASFEVLRRGGFVYVDKTVERYPGSERRVFLMGIAFSSTKRNLAAWDVVGPLL